MKKHHLLLAVLASGWALASQAAPLTLLSDLGVQGALRYCEYNNGKVYAVNPGDTCPATMQEPTNNGKGIGLFMGESHEGTSKLCVYRAGGQEKTLRMPTNANCPLNHEF